MTPAAATIVVIDNHESVRAGIEAMLRASPSEFALAGSYAHVSDLDLVSGRAPMIVVLDLYLGRDDESSLPWIPQLCAWGTAVVLHTSEERPVPLRQAVAAGAAGMTLKNDGSQALRDALLVVAGGGFACSSVLARALVSDPANAAALTPREVEVLSAIDDGLRYRDVAKRLAITDHTVKNHLESARTKYLQLGRDVPNSIALVREATRDGWLR